MRTILAMILTIAAVAVAQTAPPATSAAGSGNAVRVAGDSLRHGKLAKPARSDTAAIANANSQGELDLGNIDIQAIIEKPNVGIIPTRIKPDLQEILVLERSFERELQEIPKNLMLLDDDVDRPQKVSGLENVIKKTLTGDLPEKNK